ncbi:hypothetical protein COU15_02670 [Candidatus Kaiserbacteria bacterium CG10_big_fil_rev_8_21_14_0_10_45_20]|uniref:UDP-N-acetylmuramoyl-L-alanyl-D-glutamate--2, 6-diaminopimelate ligase n=1 Tax=Candidatus Kaiserbacteria bacterium CG10_big_fil_rev_8_21_14_0_10_45_20 TaxID=1974607 RepID=A0A2H0UF56_9BACT|nr:MAG: hypothetical protein COU15_02670 [Candidatus Kaiserbacteria bacterium CG10_big_fil_rev_8_21_14_0_10_45_20]
MLHSKPVEFVLSILKKVLPPSAQKAGRKLWHPMLSFITAVVNGFPAKKMYVIGVTGTKGKSTVSDMLYHILSSTGHKTALASTIHFIIDDTETPNKFKMTMPGRGFLQGFLKKALRHNVQYAVIEITSEGTKLDRHKYLSLNSLIVTNIEKEHIESHGSFENYVAAKRKIVQQLAVSSKKNRVLVVNNDNEHTSAFNNASIENRLLFSKDELENVRSSTVHVSFSYKNVAFTIPLPGIFNAYNALSVIKIGESLNIPLEKMSDAFTTLPQVRGRVEPVNEGQNFDVIVDYAHTPESLKALYSAFSSAHKICILGNTGGGRDTWKRPIMGAIADTLCESVILTNEDPYDEDPMKIITEMTPDMKRKPRIILNRREAIREALKEASAITGDKKPAVLISGKGTDPYIMEANGKRTPWSDSRVASEELRALGNKT